MTQHKAGPQSDCPAQACKQQVAEKAAKQYVFSVRGPNDTFDEEVYLSVNDVDLAARAACYAFAEDGDDPYDPKNWEAEFIEETTEEKTGIASFILPTDEQLVTARRCDNSAARCAALEGALTGLVEAATVAHGLVEEHVPEKYWRDLIRDLISTALAAAAALNTEGGAE